jgi:hypothetical protein
VLNKSLRNVRSDWLKLGPCESGCEKRRRRANAGAAETGVAGEHEKNSGLELHYPLWHFGTDFNSTFPFMVLLSRGIVRGAQTSCGEISPRLRNSSSSRKPDDSPSEE